MPGLELGKRQVEYPGDMACIRGLPVAGGTSEISRFVFVQKLQVAENLGLSPRMFVRKLLENEKILFISD